MQLTAIIVNYNVKHYVLQCLLSLRRAAKGLDWEVFVVDNNSSDGSVEYLKENFSEGSFPQLHIISNADNPGYGKAN
ncbi:MAG: glycosyltransferase, partial [Bacteroidaceae bacterium]|nr:glycosyltransferase [Bacteroidaceae bacterium]